jgi:hypothetical protein
MNRQFSTGGGQQKQPHLGNQSAEQSPGLLPELLSSAYEINGDRRRFWSMNPSSGLRKLTRTGGEMEIDELWSDVMDGNDTAVSSCITKFTHSGSLVHMIDNTSMSSRDAYAIELAKLKGLRANVSSFAAGIGLKELQGFEPIDESDIRSMDGIWNELAKNLLFYTDKGFLIVRKVNDGKRYGL